MKLALIAAALTAIGGLVGRETVESHLREAQATPERDFRALIDMARGAIDQVVNAGKLPADRRYAGITAMYGDRIVIELDGKHWQYGYTLQMVNGTETMVLSGPVQVVNQFVAVATESKVKEALAPADASFREAADGSIEVTLIRAGASGNGNFYPDATLRDAVPLFEGVRVFAKSDADHVQGKGKDVRGLIGGVYSVRFVEGATPDTGRLVGTFKPIDPADVVVTKMTEAVKRGMQGLMGLSIDAIAKTKVRTEGGARLREAARFTKVNSVDLIVEPGAGGGLDRLAEAADAALSPSTVPLTSRSSTGDPAMLKQRMYEAIKARNPILAATLNVETATDEQVLAMYEAVMAHSAPPPAASPAPAASSQRLAEGQGNGSGTGSGDDQTPVTRAELQLITLRQTAATRIAASRLPQAAKDRLQADFAGRERFVEADIDAAIKSEGEYLARFTESGAVRVPVFGAGSIQMGDKSVQITDMLNAFFDPAHKDHRAVQSFRECYIEITGDRRVTGEWVNVDKTRLAESLGEAYRESITSATFANALGDSITRRMQAIFTGLTMLDTWRKVATSGPVSDFRTQERFRIGGYGNLPAVAQGAAYAALTSPGDNKATYAVSKRGGTEDVTLETIKNDDVQALRRIPMELALAAKNTLYEFVFDFYRTNPNASDGVALFHASHANLFTAALSAAEFAAHRLAMVKQTRAGSAKRMGVAPAVVLVPFELQETAYNLFVRNQNLDKTFVQTINPEVIPVSYWTDANDWCSVADPNVLPVLEIGFLDGREEPELFVQDMPNVGSMFSNDKITYKIRHIYGGNILVDGEKAATKAVVP